MQSVRVRHGRHEIAVRVAGEGPPVMLIHGIPGSAGVWDPVVGRLVAGGHRVLAPDLLGFGGSSRPREVEALWIDSQGEALVAVLHQLAGGPVRLVGHDYGAPISVALTRSQPERV